MDISGTGISTTITVKVKPRYKPITMLALDWVQAADGNWYAQDRGTAADIYAADFDLYRWETDINEFLEAYQDNRDGYSNELTLSNFAETEYIFGADVDHSGSISATITEISGRRQGSWKGWGVSVKAQNLSPSFTGSSTLPSLRRILVGYNADSTNTINKYDTYNGTFTYMDREADSGYFNANLILDTDDMRNMRRYLATVRGSSFSVPALFGVDYPYGPRRGNTYPLTVKCIEWEDMGMVDVLRWRLKLKLVEVI